MKIIVGSKNKAKVAAVEDLIKDYSCIAHADISGVNAESGVSEQPLTLEETVQGAVNRAKDVIKDGGDYGFGIESGLMTVPNTLSGHLDMCVCAIADKDDVYIGLSSAWEFPNPEVVRSMLEEGLDMAQACVKHGLTDDPSLGEKGGAVNIVTNGRLDRKSYTQEAIRNALIHLEHKLNR